jgi:uncharacterized membrane protein
MPAMAFFVPFIPGINARVPQSRWDGIVAGIVSGIKEKRQGSAISKKVKGTY